MGVAVSNWRLARAVAQAGQLGVVSGTGIDTVLIRRLQDGDEGGHLRRAIDHFPIAGVGDDVLHRYYLPKGRGVGVPYRLLSMYKRVVTAARDRVTMLANFVEVWLAKEGHDGVVGVNLLTKVQMPTLPSLYGAMLGGVDYVIMGAGIPREIPGVLDALAEHRATAIKFEVLGGGPMQLTFDPADHWPSPLHALKRPFFLPVISASSLAATLAKKANGRVDGFVVEGPTAGGHNAPPRGEPHLNDRGEPIYGERDIVDLAKMRELGLPFWLAGGVGSPAALELALADGATGIQVGTLFAFSDESGLTPEIKSRVFAAVSDSTASVRTDPRASPTGYPFKVVELPVHMAPPVERTRVCDLGYLRVAVQTPEGRIDYRCPSEPVNAYLGKGGVVAETVGRRCLCNGLMSDVGLGQWRGGSLEPELVTSGDDLSSILAVTGGGAGYSAGQALNYLLPV
jgi:NAD(P)H-dependent flavin oxidoreductase YrpB (nitropropane dioxygenase family)